MNYLYLVTITIFFKQQKQNTMKQKILIIGVALMTVATIFTACKKDSESKKIDDTKNFLQQPNSAGLFYLDSIVNSNSSGNFVDDYTVNHETAYNVLYVGDSATATFTDKYLIMHNSNWDTFDTDPYDSAQYTMKSESVMQLTASNTTIDFNILQKGNGKFVFGGYDAAYSQTETYYFHY